MRTGRFPLLPRSKEVGIFMRFCRKIWNSLFCCLLPPESLGTRVKPIMQLVARTRINLHTFEDDKDLLQHPLTWELFLELDTSQKPRITRCKRHYWMQCISRSRRCML